MDEEINITRCNREKIRERGEKKDEVNVEKEKILGTEWKEAEKDKEENCNEKKKTCEKT